MIYCSTNNVRGRLGNQVMRVMSLMGLAERYRTGWAIPAWKYARYFENVIPQQELAGIAVQEPAFHYTPQFWDLLDYTKIIDIKGFLQSPKYWTQKLRFKACYLQEIRQKFGVAPNALAMSVRRGDFVGNPCFFQLSDAYYLSALERFANRRRRQLLVCSDDLNYCEQHFGHLPNVTFAHGLDIEQLAAMTLCRDFIISNSTFSYVGAYLADADSVLRPLHNFAPGLAERPSEKDYWPAAWQIHQA